jgi:hypothetical protein
MKKLPEVRLDHVIEYGELLSRHVSGFEPSLLLLCLT